ncbi:SMP-30/gluconolactonase/LRE family protein [Actinomadura sp. B10D3]|uniref:SMP-30/gluconolactonase/LRE family protein n=1 Tax=Actinomadura sp. B10D3 TaxID=3153557 RepID=UPI00325E70C9
MAAAATALAASLASPAAAREHRPSISTAYVLPGDRVYPEGIAADPRDGTLYAGSFQDGTVYRMRPGRRVAEVFLPPGADGRRTANGIKVDRAGRLWVIDSTSGVAVYDTRSRRLLARFTVPGDEARFVNDLAIAPDGGAYLTDTTRAVVYQVTPQDLADARGGSAALTVRFDLDGVLEPHKPGDFTLNGIVADPAGRFLLTGDMLGGDLYRLDIQSGSRSGAPAERRGPSGGVGGRPPTGVQTGAVRKVALSGGDMHNTDGLDLQHGRLWTADNLDNEVTRWRVTADGTRARLERTLADPSLQVPTTLVRRGGTLYVVRSQFDKGGPLGEGTPEIPFTIAAVRGI